MDNLLRPNFELAIQTNNNVEFPYLSLRNAWWDSSILTLAIYLDSTNGNDLSDGLSWSTAKKSLASAKTLIPYDLKGINVFLFFHPGVYLEDVLNFTHINGFIKFFWVGTYINSSASAFAQYVKNGTSNPIRNDDQCVLNMKQSLALTSILCSCQYEFHQCDYNVSLNSVGFCYWNKFVLKKASSADGGNGGALLFFSNCIFSNDEGYTLDFSEVTTNCSPVESLCNSSIIINAIKIIGGNTGAGQATGDCIGAFFVNNDSIQFKKLTIGFAVGFESMSGKQWEITNYKQLITSAYNMPTIFNIDIPTDAISFTAGVTGLTAPIITIGAQSTGFFFLNQTQITFVDCSISSRQVKNYVDNILKTILSNNVFEFTNNVLTKTKNAVPADALISNEYASFYLDQTANMLKVKLKYSDGTVKTGEIALV